MDARTSPAPERHEGKTWRERLWLLCFLVTQLVALWQCYGRWFFGVLPSHGA
jgi:hypothetical protein